MAIIFDVDGTEYAATIETAEPAEMPSWSDVRKKARVTLGGAGIGTMFLDRRGDCVVAVSAAAGRIFRPGSARDLIREWVATHEPIDPNPTPEQCHECGAYRIGDAPGWKTETVDLDPGDPEVGPQPDVQEVPICSPCWQRNLWIATCEGSIKHFRARNDAAGVAIWQRTLLAARAARHRARTQ
jgi:hypothetical protein